MKRSLMILAFLLGASCAWGGSLLTNSGDFSKAATYGMNLATYSMEKTNAKDAAEKLVTYDVVWDLLGKGEEVLLNGDPDAFPKLKDDILKIKLVLDKVAEVSAKLGEGVYDEALMGSVDAMVGVVNHPVVNGLWEAVKLAYQSHKLVQDSRAALEIETLYGVVNHDRRLRGESSGDGPRLLRVDSDTVTYFFNKYLITDESTRGLVKAYVKNQLGEEFPELPSSSSAAAWLRGTLDEEQNEHEVRLLQEFENTSRRWIMALLKDLNAQVKQEWVATRLHQEQEKFKAFAAQVGKAFANTDQLFEYYANQAALRKQAATFPGKLKELAGRKAKLETAYSSLKPAQFSERMTVRSGLHEIMSEANRYAVSCLIINDFALQKEFETLHLATLQRLDAIDKEVAAQGEAAAEEVLNGPRSPGEADEYRAYERLLAARFQPAVEGATALLAGYEPPEDAEISALLADNKLQGATDLFNSWRQEQATLFEQAQTVFADELRTIEEGERPPYTETPRWQRFLSERNPPQTWRDYAIAEATAERDLYWRHAAEKAREAFGVAAGAAALTFGRDQQETAQVLEYFAAEARRVRAAVTENLATIRAIKGQIADYILALSPGNSYRDSIIDNFSLADFNPAATIDEAAAYLQDNRHVAIGNIKDDDVTIGAIAWQIQKRRDQIAAPIGILAGYIDSINAVSILTARIRAAQRLAGDFKPLDEQTVAIYNDLAAYSSEQAAYAAEQSRRDNPLGNPTPDFGWTRIDYRKQLDSLGGLAGMNPNALEAKGEQLIRQIEQDLGNRQPDIDYLADLKQEFTAWLETQLRNGVIARDSQTGQYVPRGALAPDPKTGHAILSTPYPHFATAEEIAREPQLIQARQELAKLRVYQFIQTAMPATKALLDTFFTGSGFYLPAREENFLAGMYPVWKSDLVEARRILQGLTPKSGNYRQQLERVAELLPLTVEFPPLPTDRPADRAAKIHHEIGRFRENASFQHLDFALGKEFGALRTLVQELIIGKGRLLEADSLAETQAATGRERLAEFRQLFDAIAADTDRLLRQQAVKQPDYDEISSRYWELRRRYDGDRHAQDSAFTGQLAAYEKTLAALSGKILGEQQEIQNFYAAFKAAYEAKNDSGVVNCLGDNWEAGDGTTLADLQGYLRNSFSVFDEIRYSQSNLQVQPFSQGTLRVTYDLAITARIYADDIRHEEKSAVSEELAVDDRGQLRIIRTLGGRFWSVQ